MYVCICNALRDRELEAAAHDACASSSTPMVADVFKRCGTRPQCGRCLPDVATMIDDARAAAQSDDAATPLAAE